MQHCFPNIGSLTEESAKDVRLTKQDVGSFVSGIDMEVPLPDIGRFEFFPSEDV